MIVLQFLKGNDLGARAIQWFSHSPYSHVDTVLPGGKLFGARSDETGGAPPGVQARDPSYVQGCQVLRVELDCVKDIEDSYLYFLRAQEGKPYDETAILGFISGRSWRDDDKWFCSELVAFGLEKAGYFGCLSTPSNKITPADLLLALSAKKPLQVA